MLLNNKNYIESDIVSEYIRSFPTDHQTKLEQMRECFFSTIPGVEENMSYGMPEYKLGKIKMWFGAYKNHIGLYPIYHLEQFKSEMAPYLGKSTKSTLQFKYDQELPLPLIRKWIKAKFGL